MNFLLNRRITICMLFIALSLLGYVSYKQLPVELLPNAELPVLFIQVSSQPPLLQTLKLLRLQNRFLTHSALKI